MPTPFACEALEPRRLLTAGDLDPTFGTGGVVRVTREGLPFHVRSVGAALLPDGGVAVVGAMDDATGVNLAFAGLRADGSPDPAFCPGGVAAFDPAFYHSPSQNVVATQPDGKVLLGGSAPHGSDGLLGFAVGRFNADGTIDPTFGQSGHAYLLFNRRQAWAEAISVQPDGKVVIAGCLSTPSGDKGGLLLARYNADGSPDLTFGTGGVVINGSRCDPDTMLALASDAGGKILVAFGDSTDGGPYNAISKAKVVRLDADGSPDSGFGDGGTWVCPLAGKSAAFSVAVRDDGRIDVGGSVLRSARRCRTHDLNHAAVFQLTAAGRPDSAFGAGGATILPQSTRNNALYARGGSMALQADGGVLLAFSSGRSFDLKVARLNPAGRLDAAFGDGGIATSHLPGDNAPGALFVRPDGTILAVAGSDDLYMRAPDGYDHYLESGDYALHSVAFNADGTPDAAHGTAGEIATPFPDTNPTNLVSLALAPGGKPLALANSPSSSDGFLRRFDGGGAIDSSFDPYASSFDGGSAQTVALRPDGASVVAFPDGVGGISLYQFHADGPEDSNFGNALGMATNTLDPSRNYEVQQLAVLADGNIVATALAYDTSSSGLPAQSVLAVFSPQGVLVRAVVTGQEGAPESGAGGVPLLRYLAFAPDGTIVVAGSDNLSNQPFVRRYHEDLSAAPVAAPGFAPLDLAVRAVAVQGDGKIVLAGEFLGYNPSAPVGMNFALLRYNADGSRDTAFGDGSFGGGLARTSALLGGAFSCVAIEAGGEIVAGGVAFPDSSDAGLPNVVARFNADGTPDPSFGVGGVSRQNFGGEAELNQLAPGSGSTIYVGGNADPPPPLVPGDRAFVARLQG